MEIRQLEALIGIADQGSFSSAAETLGTVQSNISSRIAKLEAALGTPLVERSTGRLTESGSVVVERARRILAEIRGIDEDVAELQADIRGEVNLGMIGTAGRWMVPSLFEAQRVAFPHIALRITEGTNSAIEPRIVSGQLDLAVLAWPLAAPELLETPLFDEDLVLIVPKHHELARVEHPLPFATAAALELLLPMEGTPIRREINEAARASKVTLRPLMELDGLRTIASLAFDGHGPAILPATMLSQHLRPTFAAIPISGINQRRVVLATRRFGFPPAPVRAVHTLLLDVLRQTRELPSGIVLCGD